MHIRSESCRPKAVHPGTPRRLLAHLALALLGTLPLYATPAQAALQQVRFHVLHDGEPPANGGALTANFDTTDGPGRDSGPNNGIVRTHDEFQYGITYSNDAAEQLRFQIQLPPSPIGTPIARWKYLPSGCDTGLSTLSDDGQRIDCVLQSRGSGTATLYVNGVVLSTARNGMTIPAPSLQASSGNSAPVRLNQTPDTLTVSAAPFYDVRVGMPNSGGAGALTGNGPNGESGFYHQVLIGVVARNPGGFGRKGVEQLAPGQPIEIDLDLSGYPASVRVDDWRPANTAGIGSFLDGCGSPSAGGDRPHRLSGTVNMAWRVNDTGKDWSTLNPATVFSHVANGGDCEVVSSSRNAVRLRLTGTDSSLNHVPTRLGESRFLPTDEFWIAHKALLLWTDLKDYPNGQAVRHEPRITASSAISLSGQRMSGDVPSNNIARYPLTNASSGAASKTFVPDNSLPPPYAAIKDSTIPANVVNQIAPGQTVGSALILNNNGATPHSGIMLCEIIDRTAFDIGTNFRASAGGSEPAGASIRYGARSSGSPFFASTDSAATEYEQGAAGNSAYSSASCNDAGIRWFNTPAEAQAAGGLTYVRLQKPTLSSNRTVSLTVYGLIMRKTWGGTIRVETPTATTRRAGAPISEGTIIRNRGQIVSATVPALENHPATRDHIKVISTQTISRVTKEIVEPANAGTTPVRTGSNIRYRLDARHSTTFPPTAGEVTISDILPPGMRYVNGSGTVGDQPREPSIQANRPAPGYTTLLWRFPDVTPHLGRPTDAGALIPRIEFQARINQSVADGATLLNQATIHSPSDVDAACTFNAGTGMLNSCQKSSSASIKVESPPGFFLEKSTSRGVIEPGDDFDYTIGYLQVGSERDDLPDMIDILPFVGDGVANDAMRFTARTPPSRFEPGAYRLRSVEPPAVDPAARIYYTAQPPHAIHSDPRDDSNRIPGGSTRWCLAAEFGSAGCPASVGESTAVRISPSITNLPANRPFEATLNLVTDPLLAVPGTIFSNRVSARTVSPTSPLFYVESQSNLRVTIGGRTGSLGGQFLADVAQDGQLDASDWALADQCVTLRGTNRQGHTLLMSMRTDAQGRFDFVQDAPHPIYRSDDCSGAPLPRFAGLLAGDYTLSRQAAPADARLSEGAVHAGQAGGDAGAHQITGISLEEGMHAGGYLFTARAIRPQLTMSASISNDHAGTATPADLKLRVSSVRTLDGSTINQGGASGSAETTGLELPVGEYLLSRDELPGYVAGNWQCRINGQPPVEGNSLSLTHGDRAECTITYDDAAPTLTLGSVVRNDHGGTRTTADVLLQATHQPSGTVISGPHDSPAVTAAQVAAGDYTLSAPELPGYTRGAWACTVDGQPLAQTTPLALRAAQHTRCVIEYDDQPARLTLGTQLDIRHGRSAQATDFVLRAEGISQGAPTLSGRTGEASITDAELPAGTYALRETPVENFVSSGPWQCALTRADGSSQPAAPAGESRISLGNGERMHCTIINTDTPWRVDVALEKELYANVTQPGEEISYRLRLVSRAEDVRAPNIPEIIDILPFNGDGVANEALSRGERTPASSFEPGTVVLRRIGTGTGDRATKIYFTHRAPAEIHNDPQHPSNRLNGGETRWCLYAELGRVSGCPTEMSEATAVRIVPGITSLTANQPFIIDITLQTHILRSVHGNTFANRAGARPVDPASTLGYIQSPPNLAIDVHAKVSALSGRVFVDVDQDNVVDPEDWGIPDQCIQIDGTLHDSPYPFLASTLTDSEGRFSFEPGARDRIFADPDCRGTPVPSFGGVLRGLYMVTRHDAPTPAHQKRGAVHIGTHQGTVNPDLVIQSVRMNGTENATGYHFTDTVTLPRLTLQAQVTNDDGGSASAADFPLRAHATRTTDGSEPRFDGRHGAPAVTGVAVPPGDYLLATDSLPGYRAGTWQCVVDGAAPVSANTLSLSWGNEAVCTLVHDDQAARLTLSRVLDIRHGRPASEPDFVLGATGPAGSTALSGIMGAPALTQARVGAGLWTLDAAEVEGFTHGAWRCTVTLPDGTSTERAPEAERILIHGDESVHCTVTYHDAPLLIELTQVLTDSGSGTASAAAVPGLPEPVLYVSPLSEPSRRIAITRSQPATDGLRFGEQYAFSVSQTPGYDTRLICLDASQRELPSPVRLSTGDLARVSCRIERKRIPTELSLTKAVVGALRPVAGSHTDYEIDYALTVQHTGGDAGIYDLADVPGFDPDVQIVSHAVSLGEAPVAVTPVEGRWPLATRRALAIGASDTWRMRLRLRVPYGSNNANNRCTGAAGHGLFNQAQLANRNDLAAGSADASASSSRSASACVDTPVPANQAVLAIDKSSSSRSAEVGELVSYRLRIRNSGQGPAVSPVVVDTLPRGFTLDPGSIRVQGATLVAAHSQGRQLRVQLDRIEPAASSRNSTEVLITYRTRIGVGAQEGDATNRAHVECPSPTGNGLHACSNESRWKLRIKPGIFSEEACVAGQIFVDCNGNSVKDTEEPGIPGVRLYLQNGTWLVSDEQGKYSHCGLRPRTHVLKVDSRTLPRRSRLVTSSAQNTGDAHSLFIDARKGQLHRADFVEGSCSAAVIEQVKARQQQGTGDSVQTEPGQPALTFESKKGHNARPRQQGTDPAQPAARTRH